NGLLETLPLVATSSKVSVEVAVSPFSPFSPGKPCGPRAPVSPFSPFSPGKPCGPRAPVSPFSPFSPVRPCRPLAPGSPFSLFSLLQVFPYLHLLSTSYHYYQYKGLSHRHLCLLFHLYRLYFQRH